MRKLTPVDRNDKPLQISNPMPEGFIITEKAMQEIRERVIPDGVAMVCQATFIREATDEMPEPEWTVTILRGRFEEKEFPEIAGVRFLFPNCTMDELVGRTLDFTEKGGFQLMSDRARMEVKATGRNKQHPMSNPVPKGFTVTESAVQEIRKRALPKSFAKLGWVAWIRSATEENPGPEFEVVILTMDFDVAEVPEIAGVRFLFSDNCQPDLVG